VEKVVLDYGNKWKWGGGLGDRALRSKQPSQQIRQRLRETVGFQPHGQAFFQAQADEMERLVKQQVGFFYIWLQYLL
jgi:hypothetical protein